MPNTQTTLALGLLALVLAQGLAVPASAHSGMVLLALDTSGDGNDLQPVNAYRDAAPAKYNNAMTFNGTTSYLQRINGGAIISNSRLTVCTWIKPNTNTGTHSIIYQDGGLYVNQTNLDLAAQVRWTSGGASPTESTQTVTATNALTFGAWKHACIVADNTAGAGTQTTLAIFLDGTQAAQTNFVTGTGSMQSAKATLFIGGTPTPTGVANPYHGWLDDTIWCAAFAATTAQLNTIRNTDGSGNPGSVCGANLKAVWKFDEIASGAPTSAPASGYIDPVNLTGEAPYSRWMHVRGDASTLEMRIDVDGDGILDIVVGASREPGLSQNKARAGRVYVFAGADLAPQMGVESARLTLIGSGTDHRLGTRVAGGHDVTGDGVPDLLVSAPLAFAEHGFVAVVPGTATRSSVLESAATVIVTGDMPADELGRHSLT